MSLFLLGLYLVITFTVPFRLSIGAPYSPEGWWFKPQFSHGNNCTAVEPLNTALNPALLKGGLSPAYSNQLSRFG